MTNLSVGYGAAGNITRKSDLGSCDYATAQAGCTYHAHAQPHAVRRAGSMVMCDKPNQVSYAGNSTQFFYNANHQRWKQVANYGGVSETTWYIGGMLEKVLRGGVTEFRHLIPAGSSTALYTRRDNGTNGTYYLTSDHLGSGDLVLDSAARVRPQ